jgi:tetratricopeptide (TPR) repeat protein
MLIRVRVFAVWLLCFLAGGAHAQSSRVEQIWDIANERISSQIDAWFTDGEFPRSIQLLEFQARMYPNDYDVVTNLGWMLENVDQDDAALAVYIRFRRDNPNSPDGPLPEAEFYFRKRAYAKVIPLLEPSIRLKPHPNAYRMLAHSYERSNLLKDSKRIWDLYLARNPSDPAAKNNRTRVEGKMRANSGVGKIG